MDYKAVAQTPEYKEMCRQRSIWSKFRDGVDHREHLSRTEVSEIHKETIRLLSARDASYEAYRAAYGHPTGADLLLMEPEMFHTFIMTGGAYLIVPFDDEFNKISMDLAHPDIDTMTYHVYPEDTEIASLKELEQAAPYWTRSGDEIPL